MKKTGDKNIIRKIIIVLIALLIIAILSYISYSMFFLIHCYDQKCFTNALQTCKYASWLKEDSESAWQLTIINYKERSSCFVKFRLLNIKKGTIDSEKLLGKDMTCIVSKTETTFPLSDMSFCTGPLKEEIQDILIKRMHDYLLKNIGQLKEEFKAI